MQRNPVTELQSRMRCSQEPSISEKRYVVRLQLVGDDRDQWPWYVVDSKTNRVVNRYGMTSDQARNLARQKNA